MLRALSPEHLLNFPSNVYYPPWLEKSSRFVVLRLLENAFVSQIITMPHLRQNSTLGSYHQPPGRRKLLISPGRHFSENLSPQQKVGMKL